jgi:ketosteroid isomerase-like protein
MKAAESKQYVLDFFAEMLAGNPKAWDRFADNGTWKLMAKAKDYPYPSDYTKKSYQELIAASGDMFPKGLRFTILSAIAEDDKVALEAESYGTHRNGNLYNNLYHLFVQLENGKIKAVREYLDSGHATEVIGRKSA